MYVNFWLVPLWLFVNCLLLLLGRQLSFNFCFGPFVPVVIVSWSDTTIDALSQSLPLWAVINGQTFREFRGWNLTWKCVWYYLGVFWFVDGIDEIMPQGLELVQANPWHDVFTQYDGCYKRLAVFNCFLAWNGSKKFQSTTFDFLYFFHILSKFCFLWSATEALDFAIISTLFGTLWEQKGKSRAVKNNAQEIASHKVFVKMWKKSLPPSHTR